MITRKLYQNYILNVIKIKPERLMQVMFDN
jgi:hypothetical protein